LKSSPLQKNPEEVCTECSSLARPTREGGQKEKKHTGDQKAEKTQKGGGVLSARKKQNEVTRSVQEPDVVKKEFHHPEFVSKDASEVGVQTSSSPREKKGSAQQAIGFGFGKS